MNGVGQACPKPGPWATGLQISYLTASSCHKINTMQTPALSKYCWYDFLIMIC